MAAGLSVFFATAFPVIWDSYIYLQIPRPPSRHHRTQKKDNRQRTSCQRTCLLGSVSFDFEDIATWFSCSISSSALDTCSCHKTEEFSAPHWTLATWQRAEDLPALLLINMSLTGSMHQKTSLRTCVFTAFPQWSSKSFKALNNLSINEEYTKIKWP